MASGAWKNCTNLELIEQPLSYVLNKWYSSKTFFDDIEEPKCLLALQEISRRLGLTSEQFTDLLRNLKPKTAKIGDIASLLEDINI